VQTPFELSENINPLVHWHSVPQGVKSFALICHDSDVPSVGDSVNVEGEVVPIDLPRVDFYHWVQVDIPSDLREIAEGASSRKVTPRGKGIDVSALGRSGMNDYTNWFEGDSQMEGVYGGYDGPCPPWNDSLVHRYYFTLYALDIKTLPLSGAFTGAKAIEAMQGHIIESSVYSGIYAINPDAKLVEGV